MLLHQYTVETPPIFYLLIDIFLHLLKYFHTIYMHTLINKPQLTQAPSHAPKRCTSIIYTSYTLIFFSCFEQSRTITFGDKQNQPQNDLQSQPKWLQIFLKMTTPLVFLFFYPICTWLTSCLILKNLKTSRCLSQRSNLTIHGEFI